MEIKLDATGLLDDLANLVGNMDAAAEAGLDAVAAATLAEKGRQVQRTYNRPIPTGKNGRPKWRRSGAWKSGQRIHKTAGTREITTVGRAADYEARLAKLPTAPDGVNRSNPASENAHREIEPKAQQIFEDEFARILNP